MGKHYKQLSIEEQAMIQTQLEMGGNQRLNGRSGPDCCLTPVDGSMTGLADELN